MAKEKIIARKGKYLTIDTPYREKNSPGFNFANNGLQGGLNGARSTANTMQQAGSLITKLFELGKGNKIGSALGKVGGKIAGGISTVANAADAFNYAVSGADMTERDNQLTAMNGLTTNAGTFDSLASDAENIQTWRDIDAQDARDTNVWQRTGNTLKNAASTFLTAPGGFWSKLGQTIGVLGAGTIGEFAGNSLAKDMAAKYNAAGQIAEQRQLNTFNNQAANINNQNYKNLWLNSAAFGGNLFDTGGNMDSIFSNGVTEVNAGGTHEQNPLEGVPMGVDSQGTPNLVEEGEVIRNDYVYSNRLHPTEEMLKSVGLPTKYKKYTYAKIAEELSKESKERPNDPISLAGIDANFEKLKAIHEQSRMEAQEKVEKNMFPDGGELSPVTVIAQGKQMPAINPFKDRSQEAFNRRMNAFKEYYSKKEPFVFPHGTDDLDEDPLKLNSVTVTVDKKQMPTFNSSASYSDKSISAFNQKMDNFRKEYTSKEPFRFLEEPEDSEKNENVNTNDNYATWMRYAPILGTGAVALSDALGLTNQPDYSPAEAALMAARNQGRVRFNPIGDYVERNPLDRNYYLTQLANQNLAAQRAANNAANRYQANAMNLASMYNAGEGIGKTLMQMDQYNAQDAMKAAEFNRGTNQYNSEGSMKEQLANRDLDAKRMEGILTAARLRADEKQRAAAARSANLTTFLDNLGALGQENMAFNMVRNNKSEYYGINRDGSLYYKPAFFDADDETKAQIESITGISASDAATDKSGNKSSKGGYLTIKNKKRR